MAVKRLDPNAVLKIVSIKDEAIDLDKSNVEAYLKHRDYKRDLVFKEGMQPTLFLVRNILTTKNKEIEKDHYIWEPQGVDPKTGKPLPATLKIEDQPGLVLKYFEAGCKEIEEFKDGQWVKESITVDSFSPAIVEEIGSFIYLRSKLGDRQKHA